MAFARHLRFGLSPSLLDGFGLLGQILKGQFEIYNTFEIHDNLEVSI